MQSNLNLIPPRGGSMVATQISRKEEEAKNAASTKFEPVELALFIKGVKSIFDSYCSTCHGQKGLGSPNRKLGNLNSPSFLRLSAHSSTSRICRLKTMLHGLMVIRGKEYEGSDDSQCDMNGRHEYYRLLLFPTSE